MRISLSFASLAFTLLCILNLPAQAQIPPADGRWHQQADENGITFYVKHNQDGSMEYRATTSLLTPFKEVAAQLSDIGYLTEWLYGFTSLEVIGADKDGSTNLYFQTEPNAAGRSRDVVANLMITQTENMCVARITSRPEMAPARPGFDRMKVFSGFIILKREPDGLCKVSFQTEISWGGRIDPLSADYEARMLTLQSVAALQQTFSGGVAREGR